VNDNEAFKTAMFDLLEEIAFAIEAVLPDEQEHAGHPVEGIKPAERVFARLLELGALDVSAAAVNRDMRSRIAELEHEVARLKKTIIIMDRLAPEAHELGFGPRTLSEFAGDEIEDFT
jgi:hypothetical protein